MHVDRVIIFDQNIESIGLVTRPRTPGEELNLVQNFIDYYSSSFLKNDKVNNLAVFIEPQIATGFPDVVFATYSPGILQNWSDERERLTVNDLKVLSHLIMTGGHTGKSLITELRMPEKVILSAIENLLDAKMILRSQGLWEARKIQNIYSIKRLVSIEANYFGG